MRYAIDYNLMWRESLKNVSAGIKPLKHLEQPRKVQAKINHIPANKKLTPLKIQTKM